MILQDIWFFLWGLLWAVYFMTDGFDLGIGTLLPFLAKGDTEKRMMYQAVGPLWNGNEVWLLTAGGVTFAAFPYVYAVMFSSLYSPLMLILFALIFRGIALEFRSQINHPGWKKLWDACFFVGSLLPAVLFGVAFANIFKCIPFDQKGVYNGTLWTLLNPYGLLGGLFFLLLFLLHGSLWLAIKCPDSLKEKAIQAGNGLWFLLTITAVVFLAATKFFTGLYDNYLAHPALWIIPLITIASLLGIKIFLKGKSFWKAWFSSALTIAGVTAFGLTGLYPNLFPSSLNPAFNLTAHNASSSPMTLKIMLVVVLIFIPLILAYQIWSYTLFKGEITKDDLSYGETH
jgi:cytochrome d ubiquinol oxidase subunit II